MAATRIHLCEEDPATMDSARAGGITVLHVEDDGAFADLSAEMLRTVTDGIEIVTAGDADAALARLAEEPVDCVVSDYDMPGRDGLELFAAVRETYPDLPFILFTGKGSEEIASEAISAGVSDYLQKGSGQDCYEMLAKRVRDAVDRYRTEERYHNLVDTAPVPVLLFGRDRRLRYANDAAIAFLGGDCMGDLAGEPMVSFLHPEDREQAVERFENRILEGEAAPEIEYRVRTVEGKIKPVTLATAPGHYRGEKVGQVVIRATPE